MAALGPQSGGPSSRFLTPVGASGVPLLAKRAVGGASIERWSTARDGSRAFPSLDELYRGTWGRPRGESWPRRPWGMPAVFAGRNGCRVGNPGFIRGKTDWGRPGIRVGYGPSIRSWLRPPWEGNPVLTLLRSVFNQPQEEIYPFSGARDRGPSENSGRKFGGIGGWDTLPINPGEIPPAGLPILPVWALGTRGPGKK